MKTIIITVSDADHEALREWFARPAEDRAGRLLVGVHEVQRWADERPPLDRFVQPMDGIVSEQKKERTFLVAASVAVDDTSEVQTAKAIAAETLSNLQSVGARVRTVVATEEE